MSERPAKSLAMRALLLLLLMGLACRDPEPPPTRLFEDGFESLCDGVPCGWEQIAGPDGGVRYVETILAGEHGIELSGDGTAVRGPGGPERTATLTFGTIEARVSGICDERALLVVDAAIVDVERGLSDTFSGVAALPNEFGASSTFVQLTGSRALLDGGISGGPLGSPTIQVTALAFRVQGAGTCTIDHVVVDDTNLTDTPTPRAC